MAGSARRGRWILLGIGSSSLPSLASRMFCGLRGGTERETASSSITSSMSTEGDRVRGGPAGFAATVGALFFVADFAADFAGALAFGFFRGAALSSPTGSPLAFSGALRLRGPPSVRGSVLEETEAISVWIFCGAIFFRLC